MAVAESSNELRGPRCCIHVGINKTGTTTMQRHLFRRHKDVAYLGKISTWNSRKHRNRAVRRLLIRLTGERLVQKEADAMRVIYQEEVAPLLAGDQVPVWSNEGLCMASAPRRMARAQNILEVFGPQNRSYLSNRVSLT